MFQLFLGRANSCFVSINYFVKHLWLNIIIFLNNRYTSYMHNLHKNTLYGQYNYIVIYRYVQYVQIGMFSDFLSYESWDRFPFVFS